jgi:hypothetical protein
MMTPRDMSAELDAARRTARSEFSASLMSNSKWRVFFSAVSSVKPAIQQLIVKCINDERAQRTSLPLLYPPHPFVSIFELGGPVPLIELEWVEVPETAVFVRRNNLPARLVKQDIEAVEVALERTGKRYELQLTETGLRVWGHMR